ncbi:ABC transporter ATP-binding protein [Abyssisolibacter fermentans]|uniref:ABC transporter ATP-binding protein n=1 Tax=Abyssisolibacter fermentans TaxID=1766203 RepID=UPI0008363486|nr:ABC transporter ATP-binding protein [Abyssisolibacter fermentans]
MNNHDEIEYKSYDPAIMKRLMGYAKPYRHMIAFSVLLLLLATAMQLVQPLLLGGAIDTIFQKYDKTFAITEDGDIDVLNYRLKYIDLKDDEKDIKQLNKDISYATIIYINDKYYLTTELTPKDLTLLKSAKNSKQGLNISGKTLEYNGNTYKAELLNKEDIKILRKMDFDKLKNLVLIYLLLLIVGMITAYYQAILLQRTGQKIIYNIRNEIFAHIEGLSINYFNNNPVGKLVTRVTNDTETLNEMYTSVIANSIKNIFILVGIIAMMFSLNVKLTLIVLAIVPVILVITIVYKKYSRENFRMVRTRVAKINTFLSEHIQGMKIIQIFGMEEKVYEEFDKINKNLLNSNLKAIILFGIYKPLMYAMYITGICLVLGIGGNMVLKGTLTIGTLVIFFQYNTRFFQPIQELAEQFNVLQSAMASAEKIFRVLDTKDSINNPKESKKFNEVKGQIEFKNVWFAYDNDDYVLRDVSFKVNPGETVAFVGATGAGKTSILNLISRYYDIQKGQILVDGVDVRDYDKESIRRNVGQMLQDVFLFSGDIKSNIRLRNDEITIEEIQKAAKYVNADYFIQKLPNKYDEKVYERGATFSAGQRQLLSFARTLVFNPAILILDEATANIDTETELLIQDAMQKLMKGRTTLVVAHRLSTIQHADKIIVLHKGKIREMGSHQELLLKKGMYYKLYELQYKDQVKKEV